MYNKDFFIYTVWFLSSYFPLYIFVLILRWGYFSQHLCEPLCMIILGTMVILFGISFFMIYVIRSLGNGNITRIEGDMEPEDENIMSYTFTYILPLAGSVPNASTELIKVNILLFVLMWILYVKMRLIYLNPILILMGCRVYKMRDCHLITDVSLNKLSRNKGERLYGLYISNNVFVAKQLFNKHIE